MSSGVITLEEQTDWATDLLESLSDTGTSVSTTVSWLQSNLGKLNSHLRTEFILSGDRDGGVSGLEPVISPDMTQIQSGIYNEMYFCYWLNKKSRQMVGSMDYDWVEMQGEDQGKVKRVSNTEKSKVYKDLAKDCQENLKELIKEYQGGNFAITRQITFTNRRSAPDHMGYNWNWSDYNPICEE